MLASLLRPPALAVALVLATAGCEVLLLAGGVVSGLRSIATRPTEVLAQDGRIRADINQALRIELESVYATLGAQVFEGRVLLTGTTPTDAAARRAAEVVYEVDGVVQVHNEIQVREPGGLASYANDVRVANTIRLKLTEMDEIKLSVDSELEVVNGVAYLIGVAPDRETIDRVADIISRVGGVEKVVLHLHVRSA